MSKGLKYSRNDIDGMIRDTVAHRKKLHEVGLIDHFGRPVPPPKPQEQVEPVTHSAHCLKCKKKTDTFTEKVEDTKTGGKHASGKCSVCGTKTYAFMTKQDGQKLQESLESNRAMTGGVK